MDYTRIQPLTLREYIAQHEQFFIDAGLMPDVLRLLDDEENDDDTRT